MRERSDELAELTIDVAVVTFENDFFARRYADEFGLSWPVLIDESRTLYRAYGMLTASFRDVWSFATLRVYLKEMAKGKRPGRTGGDVYQRGGDVLVDPSGIVRLHHVGAGPADRPTVEEILRARCGR